MRVLCDQNVARVYLEAFRIADWLTATTVREELAPDAPDDEISRYATANDWVLFTSDDDLLEYDDHGVVLYHQHERPSPGGVLAALRTTDEMYADHREIRQYVPGEWGSES